MANILKGGFHIVDSTRWRARRYEVASGYATALFTGDLVTLVTAGTVEACTAGGAPLILGAVKTASYVANGQRQDSAYIPASTTYSPTSRGSVNSSYVWVYDAPDAEYWVCVSSNTATDTAAEIYAAVGSNMDIVAGAGSTVYGQSGFTLDGNPIAGTAQCRILEVVRMPGNDLTAANFKLRVHINEGFHCFTSAAGI